MNRTLIAFYAVFATKLMKNCYMAKLAIAILWQKWPKVTPWPYDQIGRNDSMAIANPWPHVPWSHGQIGRNNSMTVANPWPPWPKVTPWPQWFHGCSESMAAMTKMAACSIVAWPNWSQWFHGCSESVAKMAKMAACSMVAWPNWP